MFSMLVGVFGKTQAVFGMFCLIILHSQLWCTGRVKMTEVVNRSVNRSVHAYFEIGMHPQI